MIQIVYQIAKQVKIDNQSIVQKKYFDHFHPLHNYMFWIGFRQEVIPDLQTFHSYYGDHVAIYYYFFQQMISSFILPALISFIVIQFEVLNVLSVFYYYSYLFFGLGAYFYIKTLLRQKNYSLTEIEISKQAIIIILIISTPILLMTLYITQQSFRQEISFEIDNIKYFLNSVIILISGMIFRIKWQRKEHELALIWNSYDINQNQLVDKCNKFTNEPKIDPYTNERILRRTPEQKKTRIFWICLNFVLMFSLLMISFTFKIFFLNLQQFISPDAKYLYNKSLSNALQPNGILYRFPYARIILSLCQFLIITIFNRFYGNFSKSYTWNEVHKTNQSFRNSYIIKEFTFRMMNHFFHIFYIAFFSLDFYRLRNELIKIYMFQSVCTIIKETLLPLIKWKINLYKFDKQQENSKQDFLNQYNKDNQVNIEDFNLLNMNIQRKYYQESTEKFLITQMYQRKYDNFGDYINLIFKFSYVTMFAAIFPEGSYITLISFIIEYYSDYGKLQLKLYQRAIPRKTNTIGIWVSLISIICIISSFTNSFLFANATYQYQKNSFKQRNVSVMQLIPYIVFFIVEHVFLLCYICINIFMHVKPRWVRRFYEIVDKRKKQWDYSEKEQNVEQTQKEIK